MVNSRQAALGPCQTSTACGHHTVSRVQPYGICRVLYLTLSLPVAQDWQTEHSPWPAMHRLWLAQAPSTCPAMYPSANPPAGMPALSSYPSGPAAPRPAMDSGKFRVKCTQAAPQQAISKHSLPSDYLKALELMDKPPLVAVELDHAEDQAAGAPGASAAKSAGVAGSMAHEGGGQRAHAEIASPTAVPALRTAGALETTPARLLWALLAGAAQLLAGYSLLRLAIAQVQLCKHAQNSYLQH